MSDISSYIAPGGAIIGVVIGAGLTYGFGALTRRHQEAREDRTRWYNARLEAYADFLGLIVQTALLASAGTVINQESEQLPERTGLALGRIRLVGSQEATKAAHRLHHEVGVLLKATSARLRAASKGERIDDESHGPLQSARAAFEKAARKDLGH